VLSASRNIASDNVEQITKAVDIKLVAAPAGSFLPYRVQIKGALPYFVQSTEC
jgi:hypothetical protein